MLHSVGRTKKARVAALSGGTPQYRRMAGLVVAGKERHSLLLADSSAERSDTSDFLMLVLQNDTVSVLQFVWRRMG